MAFKSLQDKLDHFSSPVEMLRASQMGPYVFPIPAEFSNWRDEQRSWRETVGLLDQSLHMTDLYVEGPDTVRLLSELSVNSFKTFGRDKGKQLVVCNHDGYLIGDMVLFGLEDDRVNIVGRPPVANWVQFHAETGGYDVKVERDERAVQNPRPRKTYRFELQGPNAWALLERLNDAPLPKLKFFEMCELNVGGRKARALMHAFAGAPGLEFWGPVEEGPEVRAAILDAGKDFGLRQVGGRAYGSVCVESGWIPSPLQAVYTGEKMRPYREWLGADSFEANASLGGSFHSDRVEDYYLTPWDLDYGRLVKFDHDFIGREALERMAVGPHRTKVTLEWSVEDVLAVHASQLRPGENGKYMEAPTNHYAAHPYDRVMSDGRMVGFSIYASLVAVDRQWISLAILDPEVAEVGREVTVIWGEEGGGSPRPVVERHFQKEIRGIVRPWPYAKAARTYRPV
jgi:glycine cleavage system aminomethyltransferase T